MRQVSRKGLLSVAAAGGVLFMSAGAAHADSDATGSSQDSPGVASGNAVQAPVSVPVNLCGNTINVVGVLNPAFGNGCPSSGDGAQSPGGADADGVASGSPGVGSGNEVQLPIEVPVNACGNSVNVVGVGNGVAGNDCANGSGAGELGEAGASGESGVAGASGEQESPPVVAPQAPDQPAEPAGDEAPPDADDAPAPETRTGAREPADEASPPGGELARTGSGLEPVAMLPLGAGLLLGGALLYRRRGGRPARRG